jgi:hypothetical protein
MLRRIEDELGCTPHVNGLTPSQTKVLAALARSPRGLASARAVAAVAGVAPATATKALRDLEGRGLARRDEEAIIAGRIRRIQMIHACRNAPGWAALALSLRGARPRRRPERRDKVVPPRLRHLFWNTAPSQLVVAHGGPYIARRLLISHDLNGLAWGACNLSPSDWKDAAGTRGLDAQTRALALNLAGERG